MAILNNLYPGTVETYAPAFLLDSGNASKDTCRVYFSLSVYNSETDIANIQVTVANQYTNISMLSLDKYPCSIMIKPLLKDETRETDDKYYFEIEPSDMEGGEFEINQYYKVQFRFTSSEAPKVDYNKLDSWLTNNLAYFSEWSTVCLIRGISTPNLIIGGLDPAVDVIVWSSPRVDLVGNLVFKNPAETDTLKSYRIRLYDISDKLVSDTGDIYTSIYNGTNEINYTFHQYFKDGEEYRLVIDYATRNLYTGKVEFNFMIVEAGGERLEADISAVEDVDNGRIGIHIVDFTMTPFTGNITICRTSSESNFSVWDDIYTFALEDKILDYTWWDTTVESGVWYQYAAQKRDSLGNRGVINRLDGEYMIEFEDDLFLIADGTQIKIRFNPQISSFKYNTLESKVDTIGSKYPYIKRNGEVFYRSFPISGTISHFMDKDHLFTSREDIFKDTLELYDEHNAEFKINPWTDRTYEREFREKVMEFLYKNNVKLFKSATEGNVLVKIMDINFTPNTQLGRQLYNFSCTAYEIDECSLYNFNKYGVQSSGAVDQHLAYVNEYLGQLDEVIPAGVDVVQYLNNKYQKYAKDKFIATVDYLDWLRLEFEGYNVNGDFMSGPYLIKSEGSSITPMLNTDASSEDLNNAYLGYIAKINGEQIIVNPEGIYELKNEGTKITSLEFPVDTKVNINYHLSLSQVEDISQLHKVINYSKKVGQQWGAFEPNVSVYKQIWDKYYENYKDWSQTLISIDRVTVTANPGTVFYVKEFGEKGFDKHVIGPTYQLSFEDEESIIEGLYFVGTHLEPANDYEKLRENMPDNKYTEIEGEITDLEQVSYPVRNGVYTFAEGVRPPLPLYYNSSREEGYVSDLSEYGRRVIIESIKSKDFPYPATKYFEMYPERYTMTYGEKLDRDYTAMVNDLLANTNRYIYYNGEWYPFTDAGDIVHPVEAVVDYTCEIMKGYFVL